VDTGVLTHTKEHVMKKGIAIVAVQTNMIGWTVVPTGPIEIGSSWPFQTPREYTDEQAEIVAVHVGDLDDGGVIKFTLLGKTTGHVKTAYVHGFKVGS
jgi:hypothetical protein